MAKINFDAKNCVFNAPRSEIDIEQTIKKSRFIGSIRTILTEKDAASQIKEISSLFPNATHYCWAYRIGINDTLEHSSDDGEPSGTAGRPILGALKKYSLDNTLLVVTRFFGGTKLGVRGLIDAYSETSELTIEKAGHVEMEFHHLLQFTCGYDHSKTMTNTLRQLSIPEERISVEYVADVKYSIEVPCSLRGEVTPLLEEMLARKLLTNLIWHEEPLIRAKLG
ncbi:MAG: YigZ family protein [Synergistaceae bacterium]|jgi:uncharacterized YigZ family protein|nr:YigZ family protein [Synergistaceae bacterium]